MSWGVSGKTDFNNDAVAKETSNGVAFQGVRNTDSCVEIVVTPTISDTTANAAGDFVGTNATAITLTGAAHAAGLFTRLLEVVVTDKDKQSQPLEIWLFNAAPTVPNSNAAWNVSDADAANVVDVVPVTAWFESTLNSIGRASPWSKLKTNAAADLYAALVTRGAPTYTASGLQLRFVFARD